MWGSGARIPRAESTTASRDARGGIRRTPRLRRPGRGPDAHPEHPERAGRGDGTQLSGPHPRVQPGPGLRGAGRQRGGLALCRSTSSWATSRRSRRWRPGAIPGPCLRGGGEGKVASYLLISDGEARVLGSKATVQLAKGDRVRIKTAGGGGFGPAHERDPEAVLRDVREGKISRARAREAYGVAIRSGELAVDLRRRSDFGHEDRGRRRHRGRDHGGQRRAFPRKEGVPDASSCSRGDARRA